MNTGKGEIRVLGGYADVRGEQQHALRPGDQPPGCLPEGGRHPGDLDKAKGRRRQSHCHHLPQSGSGVIRTVDDGSGPEVTTLGSTDTYTPDDGWRYGWSVGMETFQRRYAHVRKSSWLEIDALAADPDTIEWGEYEVSSYDTPEKMPDGPYYFKAPAVVDPYTYSSTEHILENGEPEIYDRKVTSSWYGKETIHTWWVEEDKVQTIHTHTIEADRPIAVTFIGYDEGGVTIDSDSDVVVKGPIMNPSGTTTIVSGGSIEQGGDAAYVGGRRIVLTAATGIGAETPIVTNLADEPAYQYTTSTIGNPQTGLTSITTGDRVKVNPGYEEGGEPGRVYQYQGNPADFNLGTRDYGNTSLWIKISHRTSLSAGTGSGDIRISEMTGDLVVSHVKSDSGGDVSLVSQGGIYVGQSGEDSWYEGLVQGGAIHLTAQNGGIGSADHALVLDSGSTFAGAVSAFATGDVWLQEKVGDLWIHKVETGGNVAIHVASGGIRDANQAGERDERTWQELKEGVWSALQLTESTGAQNKINAALVNYAAGRELEYRTYWGYRSTQADPLVYDPTFHVSLNEAEENYYRDRMGYDDAAIAALEESRTQQYHTLHGQYGKYGNTYNPGFKYVLSTQEKADIRGGIKVWTEEELFYAIGAGLLMPVSDTEVTVEEPNVVGADVTLSTSGSVGATVGSLVIPVTQAVNLTDEQRVALAAAERDDVSYLGSPVSATVSFSASPDTIIRTDGGNWLSQGFEIGMRIRIEGNSLNATGDGAYYLVEGVSTSVLTLSADADLRSESARTVTVTPEIDDPRNTGATIAAIVIDQREDVDVHASGRIRVQAGSGVYLGSEIDLRIDMVQAGGDVRIKGGQGVFNDADAGGLNAAGGNLVLEGAEGSIGTQAKPFRIDLLEGATVTARAGTEIHLHAPNDDLNVGTLFARSGGVFLRAAGSIVDGFNTDWENIRANTVELTAENGGIGEAGDYLDVDVNGTGTLKATAQGGIRIAEVFGSMNVDRILSQGGDVDLKAHMAILDAGADPDADILGNHISLLAEFGSIGLSGNDLDIDSAYSGPGLLTSWSYDNTYLIETSGNLGLNQVGVRGDFTAFLTAPVGSILNGRTDGNPNVISGRTYLVARDHIGEGAKPITTQVGKIEGKSITGSTWVSNLGALAVGGVVDNDEPGMSAGGSVDIEASSPVVITENIRAAGAINVRAHDDPDDTGEGKADHITVRTGVTVQSLGNRVRLRAGDDLTIEAGATVQAATFVELYGDWGNADPGKGSAITINGSVSAPEIVIYGEADPDTITMDVDSPADAITGLVRVFGGAGDDLITVNRLHTRSDRLDIDGQVGADDVVVNIRGASTGYRINVFDTGADAGTDTLTVNGTEGADTFLLRASQYDYPVGVAFVAALHGDPVAQLERVNYNRNLEHLIVEARGGDDSITLDDNWALTTVLGGEGDDTFQIGQMFQSPRDALSGLAPFDEFETTLTTRGYLSNGVSYATFIDGGDGDDTFTVFRNKAALDLLGGAGDDLFTIRAFALADSTDVGAFGERRADLVHYVMNGAITITAGEGYDTVVMMGTEFADRIAMTDAEVTGTGRTIGYGEVEWLDVDAGEGHDEVSVLSTHALTATRIFGGLGSDRFTVAGEAQPVVAAAGMVPAEPGSHLTAAIAGPLSLDGLGGRGTAGGLGIPVMLSGETDNAPLDIEVIAFTGSGNVETLDTITVTTVALQALVASLGLPNANTLAEERYTLQISRGPGMRRFWQILGVTPGTLPETSELTLKSPTLPVPEWDLPAGGSRFTVNRLSSNFFVSETEQVDTVTVLNDGADSNDTGLLTSNRLQGLNMGPDTVIGGRRLQGGLTYGNAEVLTVDLGSGADTFFVGGTQRRADFQTWTLLNTGGGDDTVKVSLSNEQDGRFALDAGEGDDRVDASLSSQPLVIFGGTGNDTIDDGVGGDILFGDRGRVDFRNEDGMIVTRLGTAQETFSGTVDAAGTTSLTDSDASLPMDQGGLAGLVVRITEGTGAGQSRVIVSNTEHEITLNEAWTVNPDSTSRYSIAGVPESRTDGVFREFYAVLNIDPEIGGHDILRATLGDDILHGGAGDDLLQGGPGTDILYGGFGNDVLDAGWGTGDFLSGDQGDDILYGSNDGADVMDGGPGKTASMVSPATT